MHKVKILESVVHFSSQHMICFNFDYILDKGLAGKKPERAILGWISGTFVADPIWFYLIVFADTSLSEDIIREFMLIKNSCQLVVINIDTFL